VGVRKLIAIDKVKLLTRFNGSVEAEIAVGKQNKVILDQSAASF